jgi:hypothetical protein
MLAPSSNSRIGLHTRVIYNRPNVSLHAGVRARYGVHLINTAVRIHPYQWLRSGFDPPGVLHIDVSVTTPVVFVLKKLLYLELSRSPNGIFKPLLDPGGGFTSETAARRFQK